MEELPDLKHILRVAPPDSQPAEKRCYPVDGTCVNKSERRLASAGSFRFYLRLFNLCRIVGDKILCAVVLKAML